MGERLTHLEIVTTITTILVISVVSVIQVILHFLEVVEGQVLRLVQIQVSTIHRLVRVFSAFYPASVRLFHLEPPTEAITGVAAEVVRMVCLVVSGVGVGVVMEA